MARYIDNTGLKEKRVLFFGWFWKVGLFYKKVVGMFMYE